MSTLEMVRKLLDSGTDLERQVLVRRLTRDASGKVVVQQTTPVVPVSGTGDIIIETVNGWTDEVP